MTLKNTFGKDIYLTGWGHTKFGKLPDETLESLITKASQEALEHSGVAASDIDEVYLGTFNSSLWPLAFPSSLVLEANSALALKPATRVENACASGSAAFHQGVKALLAGTAHNVLVVGAEKMTHADATHVGAALLGADYDMAGKESTTGFTGLFADVADAYRERYGEITDELGLIAAKNHRNGVKNPYAQLRKDVGVEFCQQVSDKNPIVAGCLKRTDCSPISDGAAAVVLSLSPNVSAQTAPVRLIGFGQANDFLPKKKRDPLEFAAATEAWNRAISMAGVSVTDLGFLEVHDCFTIAELVLYEALGLTPRGAGKQAIVEGWVSKEGKLPVNISGGLKAKGHPVGATGVSQHVISAMQLTGTAGDMQLDSPHTAAVHNMGGVAIANYVSVLQAV